MQPSVMSRVTHAVGLSLQGECDQARALFTDLWSEIGPSGDAFQRCTLAHYMADLQSDPNEELLWDLRALEAADAIASETVRAYHAALSVRAFYPSLHLNLAEDYRKLGDLERARHHAARALASVDALEDDGYARTIRGGITRVAERIAGD